MKLNKPVTFTSRIQPISLPNGRNVTIGDTAVITGWGLTQPDGPITNILQHAATCIKNPKACSLSNTSSTMKICAGYVSPVIDTCLGDSGGPLIVKGSDGAYFLAGVTSYGWKCGGQGVYTRVSAYETWIEQTTRLF